MEKSVIVKCESGMIAVAADGSSCTIANKKIVSELEALVAERQRIGREISKSLKRNGLDVLHEDEPTQVIEP